VPGAASRNARIAWIALAILVVFVAWLSAASATSGIAFFYSFPIGLAAWWFGLRAALLAALLSIAFYVVGNLIHPVPHFGLALGIRAVFLVGVAAAVAWVSQRLATLEHSAEELEAIRAALTPADLPELPGVDAGAAFVPSELGVSGDFYLLTNGPDGSAVAIVGDVVGHGPAAARLATFIRARLATFVANTSDPAELLTLTNAALADRPGRHRELVSAVCVRLRPGEDKVCWARAGHPPPLRLPQLNELAADGSTFLLGAEQRLGRLHRRRHRRPPRQADARPRGPVGDPRPAHRPRRAGDGERGRTGDPRLGRPPDPRRPLPAGTEAGRLIRYA
jgi:hypothetical protein